jgi:hypothetical protein
MRRSCAVRKSSDALASSRVRCWLSDAENATITRERNGAFYRAEAYGFSMDKVATVDVDQSVLGRLLNYASTHAINMAGLLRSIRSPVLSPNFGSFCRVRVRPLSSQENACEPARSRR